MSRYIDPRQRAPADRAASLFPLMRDFGRLAHGIVIKRELDEAHIAAADVRRQLGRSSTAPGRARHWLAARVLALGARLAGQPAGPPATAETAEFQATP